MRYSQLLSLSFLTLVLWAALAAAEDNREAGLPPEIAGLSKSLRIQIDLAFRFNHRMHDARIRTVERVLQAWRVSERLPEDDARLADWLRAAIRSSSPGRRESLPPMPAFHRPDRTVRVASSPSRSVAVIAPRVEALARSTAAPDRIVSWNLDPVSAAAYALPAQESNRPTRDGASELRSFVQSASTKAPLPLAMPRRAAMESTSIVEAPSVRINRQELFSRIAGYRHRLRGIEAQLVAEEAPSARKLAQLAQELDTLAEQRELLMLYCKALGDKATTEAAPLRTTETAWRQVGRSIAVRRRELVGTGLLPSTQERQIELSILAAMERYMAEAAGKE